MVRRNLKKNETKTRHLAFHNNKIMKKITDTDPMPFGKHEGEAMQDVPARYFHWLWTNGMSDEWEKSDVGHYIYENLETLEKEWGSLDWWGEVRW